MASLDLVVHRLRSIEGIIDVWHVEESHKNVILELEKNANQNAGLAIGVEIINKGAESALQREYVLCINHSPALRHPPGPILTLFAGEALIGEEIWEEDRISKLRGDSNAIFLGRGFVLFKDKVKRIEGRRLRFEYGPLKFPEISTIQGVTDVVSCTLSPPADMFVKRMAKWETADRDFGTVLIGFNSSL